MSGNGLDPSIRDTITQLERRAADAWPSSVAEDRDGWRLRATPRVPTRKRSNSAVALREQSLERADDIISSTTDFYGRLSLPSLIQITPLSQTLDGELEARRWSKQSPTLVESIGLATLLDRTSDRSYEVRGTASVNSEWLAAWEQIFDLADAQEQADEIMARIEPEALYTSVFANGVTVGVALGVLDPPWVGIFGMGTTPCHRRKGAGSAALGAIGKWASQRGAENCYLQVEEDNAGARAFYEGIGFTSLYGYHYRVAPPAGCKAISS
ncbi:MAG: GNAT family N-acetyltransferase [Actinomycetota bacterium]|nr:GNAT family N-acetyltransferase [Actinomycetota bacterium]